MSFDDTIRTNEPTNGEFKATAGVAQALKEIMKKSGNWTALPAESKEALELTATHLSRILTGDANVAEHWNKAAASLRLRGLALGGPDTSVEAGMSQLTRRMRSIPSGERAE